MSKVRIFMPNDGEIVYLVPGEDSAKLFIEGFEIKSIEYIKQNHANKEKVFIDIGANVGSYTLNMTPNFKKVIAFEPLMRIFYALCG